MSQERLAASTAKVNTARSFSTRYIYGRGTSSLSDGLEVGRLLKAARAEDGPGARLRAYVCGVVAPVGSQEHEYADVRLPSGPPLVYKRRATRRLQSALRKRNWRGRDLPVSALQSRRVGEDQQGAHQLVLDFVDATSVQGPHSIG